MKISVLTPSYNSAKYLRRAIESVVIQGYTNWEHIIIDGGSTDGSIEIFETYPHLQWKSERDSGQSEAMNKAFDRSTGDLIVYLNADDEFEPNAFQQIIAAFRSAPRADMVVGQLRIQYPDGDRLHKSSTTLADILSYSEFKFPLNPVSYAYRRSVQQAVGPFPVSNHYTMDYWFLLRAYTIGSISTSPAIFGTFYFDGNNKSADGQRARLSLASVRKDFVRKYFYKPRVAVALMIKAWQRLVTRK